MTHAERLLRLAEQKKPCSIQHMYSDGQTGPEVPHSPQCPCGGTGKAVRFPPLRRRCQNAIPKTDTATGLDQWDDSMVHPELCQDCQGRGWVPVDDLEAALAVIDSFDLITIRNTPSMTMCRWEVELAGREPVYADSLKEAVIEALYKAEREKP